MKNDRFLNHLFIYFRRFIAQPSAKTALGNSSSFKAHINCSMHSKPFSIIGKVLFALIHLYEVKAGGEEDIGNP